MQNEIRAKPEREAYGAVRPGADGLVYHSCTMKAKLTVRSVKEAEPTGASSSYVMDEDLPGFGIRVYPTRRKVYIVRFRGKPHEIGDAAFMPLSQARAAAVALLLRLKRGEGPAVLEAFADIVRSHLGESQYLVLMERARERAASAGAVELPEVQRHTLRDLHARLVEEHFPRLSPGSAARDGRVWEVHILPELGNERVRLVTGDRVRRYHRALAETPQLANKVLSLLSHAFRLAERWDPPWRLPGTNPVAGIDRYPRYPRQRVLSEAEYGRLGEAIAQARKEGRHTEVQLSAIELLLLTGCRPGEIQQLEWSWMAEVRLPDGTPAPCLRLPRAKTDRPGQQRGRTVWLSSAALEVIQRQEPQAGSPYIFPGRRKGTHVSSLAPAWRSLRAMAGLGPDVVPYSARHSFITEGDSADVDLGVMKDLAGHKQVATTAQVYRKGKERVAAAAAERLQRHVKKLLEGGGE